MKEAMLYRQLKDDEVECRLCCHRCRIGNEAFGICGMRQNKKGRLMTHAYGRVIAANSDPIEKKPLYHFLPGSHAFSIATIGCNFRCTFCQNWQISQASEHKAPVLRGRAMSPTDIVQEAFAKSCQTIAYTYTEPTVFFEYAYDTACLAREKGLANVFITNGFMTREALKTAAPVLDACNVDLKAYNEDFYKTVCKGRLAPVLATIQCLKELNIWVEVTTLVVPGVNDGEAELRGIARFLADVDVQIPWHLSRFHPDYKYQDAEPTPLSVLQKAYHTAKQEGLQHVYFGNVVPPPEARDTRCPYCLETLIERSGPRPEIMLETNGRCPHCGAQLAGVFEMYQRESGRSDAFR